MLAILRWMALLSYDLALAVEVVERPMTRTVAAIMVFILLFFLYYTSGFA